MSATARRVATGRGLSVVLLASSASAITRRKLLDMFIVSSVD